MSYRNNPDLDLPVGIIISRADSKLQLKMPERSRIERG